MALLLPLLLSRIALILAALLMMAFISYVAGYGWCASEVASLTYDRLAISHVLCWLHATVCWPQDRIPPGSAHTPCLLCHRPHSSMRMARWTHAMMVRLHMTSTVTACV